jgi:hypothetical protein
MDVKRRHLPRLVAIDAGDEIVRFNKELVDPRFG